MAFLLVSLTGGGSSSVGGLDCLLRDRLALVLLLLDMCESVESSELSPSPVVYRKGNTHVCLEKIVSGDYSQRLFSFDRTISDISSEMTKSAGNLLNSCVN